MQNIAVTLSGYLSKLSLPNLGITDVLEIALISFFIYQFIVWIKFTRAYTLLKGILFVLLFILFAYILKMNTILWIIKNLSTILLTRSEEHTSELQSQPTISYAVFCLKKVG